jgi:molecular chaperone GrpE
MMNSEQPENERDEQNNDHEIAESGAEDRIAELEAENKRLRDQALRTVDDMENLRRRSQQEQARIIEYANERLLKELLPIVDDFRRSVEAGSQSKDYDTFYQGVQMVQNKIEKILEGQGVKKIEAVGEEFNVDLHDAMMRQPSDAPEGTVITELEPGYLYGDRVLRHAKVIVSAGN